MADYLHLRFEDGAEICVPAYEADFIIEKYEADGAAFEGAAECAGCPLSKGGDLPVELGVLDFNRSVVEAKLARLESAVRQ